MAIEQKTIFLTSDGKRFDVLEVAQKHEQALQLSKAIDDSGHTGRDCDTDALAAWLINKYGQSAFIQTKFS